MAEVWLIRHGESESNAGYVTKNASDADLTERGRQQALEVCRLFLRAPDLIVVTPYPRTQQTAEATRKRFPHSPCEVWALQEFCALDATKYGGTTTLQRGPMMRAYWDRADPDYVDGAGAESFNALLSRIKKGFEKMQALPANFFVGAFLHGYVIGVMKLLLLRPAMGAGEMMTVFSEYHSRNPVANGSILRVTADAQGVRLSQKDRKMLEMEFLSRNLMPTDSLPDM